MFGVPYYSSQRNILTPTDFVPPENFENMTVFQRLFYLDDSIDVDVLPEHILPDIASDFQSIRAAGMKCVVRFAYVNGPVVGDTEPVLTRLLGHISQLAPILQDNQDVIMVIQAGFVGPWGEWHGSSNGLDKDPGSLKQILEAILDAVPDKIVQVRTPKHKIEIFETRVALNATTAYSGENIARTGHHNDCFLASDDDVGTYVDKEFEYPYLANETLYTAMGGKIRVLNLNYSRDKLELTFCCNF